MAGKTIKGLTVEIGGDTTKLGKALESVEKKSRSLSGELGQINKLLKLDPGNTDLLAQKQKVLAEAIGNTKTKLDTLKKAEKQVQEQFKKGKASEAQVRALQREIIATEKKIDGYEKAVDETTKALKKMDKETDEVEKSSDKLGGTLASVAKTGLSALAAGVTAAVGALVGCAEASREYRAEMGKLETAFESSGHSSQTATGAYKELQSIIGETDQSVEAAQQIALLAESEQDVAKWSELAAGVVGRFGDALQPETFYEAANETLKLGEATGAYTQMLEGTGYSVEEFNKGLAACSTEAEKQAYMLEITDKLLGEAADKYRETNAEIIRANQANEEWMTAMAEVGAVVEPILTDVKLLGASLLSDLVPGIERVAEAFRGMLDGDAGAAANLGEALSGIFDQILDTVANLLPQVTEMAVSLITTLTTSIIDMLPQLLDTGVQMLVAILDGISSAYPQLVSTITEMIPQLTAALTSALPQLLEGAMTLLTSLLENIGTVLPELLPQVLDMITQLVGMIVEQISVLLPQIVSLVVTIIELLGEQLPQLVPQLVSTLVGIVALLVEQLPVIIPTLIEACVTIVAAIIEALPGILIALTEALPAMLQAVWDAIVMVFEGLPDWFGQLFTAAWELIQLAWSGVTEWFGAIWQTISDLFAPLVEWFAALFTQAWEAIQLAWSGVTEWFGAIWQSICDFFAPAAEWFAGLFSQAWEGIQSAWSSVTSWFSGIWSSIKSAFSSVSSWFTNIFQKAWNGIKNVFSGVKSFFMGIWDKIKSAFSDIGTKIGDAISGAVKKGINGLIGQAEKIINGFLKMINNAISLINKIPGVNIKKVKMVSFTRLAEGGVVDKPTPAIFGEDGAEAVVPLERNTEWIQRVAQEFLGQVKNEAGAGVLASRKAPGELASYAGDVMLNKLDKILTAIERGQVLYLDGNAVVGGTVDRMDAALGRRRNLTVRGAI